MDSHYILDYDTPSDPKLQKNLESINVHLLAKHSLRPDQVAAGVFDLKAFRLAMVRGDDLYYAASIPKIGILLAFFQLNPRAAAELTLKDRRELGLMIKASSDEMATRYSRLLGLGAIQ